MTTKGFLSRQSPESSPGKAESLETQEREEKGGAHSSVRELGDNRRWEVIIVKLT